MRTLAIDIETYSGTDISKAGVYAYVDDAEFEIQLISYKLDDDEIKTIDMHITSRCWQELQKFESLLYDSEVLKTAYNANFERVCLAKHFGRHCEPKEWECTMVKALTLGLPGALGKVGEVLGLAEDKQKLTTGKALINYFCKPCKPTKSNEGRTRNLPKHDPEKWQMFKSYNARDVEAEVAIREKLAFAKTTESEKALWELDQDINDRGVKLDIDLANKIVDHDLVYQKELSEEAAKLTGLDNPNSVKQLKQWITEQGEECVSLNKVNVQGMLDTCSDPQIKRVLEIRLLTSKTSIKKYQAMQMAVCSDQRLRGILQFYGSRTGRWAGRIVQVHNLPQNHIQDLELARELVKENDFEYLEMLYDSAPQVLSELVRTAFIPTEGYRFIVSDFSAIEARITAWLAGEQWRLDVFEAGGDIYCISASKMFHVPVEKHGINGHLRQKGKVAELACGYGGSVGAMKVMDRSGQIPEDEMQKIVNRWRQESPNICRLWRRLENAAKTCLEERRKVRLPIAKTGKHLEFSYNHNTLFVRLPSGRSLAYYGAKVSDGKIMYEGVEQATKHWGMLDTWGGTLTENIVQAIARDCLGVALTRLDKAGYNIVMHVHDEAVLDVPMRDKNAMEEINKIMAMPISWAPGLALKGDSYETPFYRKD